MRLIGSILLTLASISPFSNLQACTGIRLTTSDGSTVNGRTLEFGAPVDASVAIIPRGYPFVATSSQGPGLRYQAKYAVVGAIAGTTFAVLDGVNEKGLTIGTFYFPGYAGYAAINPDNQSRALSPVDFANWVITQFATLEEVKSNLSQVVISPTVTKEWGPSPPPFHYIVYDKTGRSLVIEPIRGQLLTFDNPLGVFTNSPTLDWHMTNLRNFINLTPNNAMPIVLDGLTLPPFGQGSGLVGLPGDFTPPSRFIRAALFSATATKVPTATEGVFQAFHILNQFDIPLGVVREKSANGFHSDYTQITSVKDPQSLKYYFKTYNDQTIRMVDLHQFDWNAKVIKTLKATDATQPVADVSKELQEKL